MISKILSSHIPIKKSPRIIYSAFRGFANEEAPKGDAKQTLENTVTTDKTVRDPRYEDMCIKFEREWKNIYDERNTKQLHALHEELTENQKKRVELVAQAMLDLNVFELRYFSAIIRDKVWKTTGVNPLKINLDWPALKQLDAGSWPPANPNWFIQQEAIAKLWPAGQQGFAQLFGGAAFAGGGATGQPAAAPAEEKKEAAKAPPKEEKKVEKTNFDIELASIDPAKKIAIIKEVRQITTLGLKEAKEMVEKTPCTLKKGVKKEDAEKIRDLLVAAGCKVNLL